MIMQKSLLLFTTAKGGGDTKIEIADGYILFLHFIQWNSDKSSC
jgi:hypothetical protein